MNKPPMRGDVLIPECPSRKVYEHVQSRWGGLILRALAREPCMRFSELKSRIGHVSEKMLSQTLKHFERDGLVERVVYSQIPPRVEYSLTQLGSDVAVAIGMICEVLEGEMETIYAHQTRYDRDPPSAPWQAPRVSTASASSTPTKDV